MRVIFLLPSPGHNPVGGFKVIYEYANGLADRGHTVAVIHPMMPIPGAPSWRNAARYVKGLITGNHRPDTWFQLHPSVAVKFVPNPDVRWIPKADAIVASAWETAEWSSSYPSDRGRKYYLIQHLETWSGSEQRVNATWKLPFHKIVISRWLQDHATQLGETSTRIPNGLDFHAFGRDLPSESRDPAQVIMLYHTADWKGSWEGIAALREARGQIPHLTATLFGTHARPEGLDEWFEYHQLPPQKTLRALYNRASIFISPSWAEGWPLPPAEAMICGCACALTDIGGHREFGLPGETCLFSPPRDAHRLAQNIVSLATDENLRLKLADRGHKYIQQFTWNRAVDAFEKALSESAEERTADGTSNFTASV